THKASPSCRRLPNPRVLARCRPPRRLSQSRPRHRGGPARMTRVGVVGLGYVGLTLAVTFAKKGFTVFGLDRAPHVIEALAAGRPHIYEPGVEEAWRAFLGERLHVATTLPREPLDAVVLCVSTPVDPATRAPDLEGLRAAARAVAERCGPDTLVIVR